MRHLSTLILFFSFISSFAQVHEIKATKFTDLTVSGPFKVTLVKASSSRAEIDYRGLNPDDVIAECSGGELEIRFRTHGFFDFDDDSYRHRDGKYATVTVYYTSLEQIEIKKGASLRSGDVLAIQNLKLISKMGSEVKLNLQVKELRLESSMGSDVDLSGTADVADFQAKMGTSIDASQLKCQEVNVSASMGADVKVFAEKELNVSASLGASVTSKGNPAKKNVSDFLGADVK
jgi:hypothetical protein